MNLILQDIVLFLLYIASLLYLIWMSCVEQCECMVQIRTEPLVRRELVEEGMLERVPQRDALRGFVLEHTRDQLEQLPRFLTVALQVPLQTNMFV